MKKRLLFITNLPVPYKVHFYNELAKHFDVTVIFEAHRTNSQRFNWIDDKISFRAIFLNDGAINERKISWNIFRYMRDLTAYDHIIITNYAYITETIALLYLKLRGVSYCYEADGGMIKQKESWWKKRIKHFLLSGAKLYFSSSKDCSRYFKHYVGRNINIVEYPFTSIAEKDLITEPLTTYQKQSIKEGLGIKEKKMVIAVGQFIERKGFDILLKAFHKITGDVGLYIIGGKADDEYIKLRDNNESIHFIDFLDDNKLAEYYKAADVFILPTREDIWGLVINEAMAKGLPIITTDQCGAGLELLPKECIIKAGDEGLLTNLIQEILNDDVIARELAIRNISTIQSYTIEEMTQKHIEAFA